MRKLTYSDLTHEFLKDVSAFTSVNQLVEYCAGKDLEIDEKNAERLLAQFRMAKELSQEALEKVSGGKTSYSGTRILSESAKKLAMDCRWDCYDREWPECQEDKYQDCMFFQCFGYELPMPS